MSSSPRELIAVPLHGDAAHDDTVPEAVARGGSAGGETTQSATAEDDIVQHGRASSSDAAAAAQSASEPGDAVTVGPHETEGALLPEQKPLSIVLTLAYDGSRFSGMAIQNNATAIGNLLLAAIRKMDPQVRRLRIASRTDAGVHARGQIVTFETRMRIPPRGWLLGISSFLPPEIAVVSAGQTPVRFDPSKKAVRKTYRYLILQGQIRDPFYNARAWLVFDKLNHDLMRAEAESLLGMHDFRAFRGSADIRKETTRHITRATIHPLVEEPRVLAFEIEGNRFMFRMVRIIAGTLVDVGRGRLEPGAVRRAIQSGNRLDLGVTAPAEGLYLERVDLAEELFEKWPSNS